MSENCPCLHLVFASPTKSDALQRCVDYSQPDDTVLLLQAGVNAILTENVKGLDKLSVYVLVHHVAARGLLQIAADTDYELIDMPRFVDLVAEYPLCQSWN